MVQAAFLLPEILSVLLGSAFQLFHFLCLRDVEQGGLGSGERGTKERDRAGQSFSMFVFVPSFSIPHISKHEQGRTSCYLAWERDSSSLPYPLPHSLPTHAHTKHVAIPQVSNTLHGFGTHRRNRSLLSSFFHCARRATATAVVSSHHTDVRPFHQVGFFQFRAQARCSVKMRCFLKRTSFALFCSVRC